MVLEGEDGLSMYTRCFSDDNKTDKKDDKTEVAVKLI